MANADSQSWRRWRLVLGGDTAGEFATEAPLEGIEIELDRVLSALYDSERRGGLGSSSPHIARWLGDIRSYFPRSVVQVMQRDALERLNLQQMLLEPELLETVEPDVKLAADLIALKEVMPSETRETSRQIVRRVVEDLERRLIHPTRQAVVGSLHRADRNHRPRHSEIDWPRTIRANLKHYQPAYRTVVPDTLIGCGRKRSSLRDIVLCIDQSGSMATSVVYAGLFGSVLASLTAIETRLVAFDTSVVDLTEALDDPVEVLFGMQLGGGTDLRQALAYCQTQIHRPLDTIFVLISDLFEGGDEEEFLKRVEELVGAGVQFVALLALSDEGAPAFSQSNAERLAALGVPSFACTPELFPELMAAAIERRDLTQWMATHLEMK
ncbi:MAG: VWA domain-containing protein [Cyanobacteria bacterium SID2]|nr:VWA domain-containing protein [Cyanobacteria bacterium SID2]MBP0005924.1 VWA domain-containing protein [Cyanobacteria bacterium SBC]